MTIELPQFEDKYGIALSVCGRLKSPVSKAQSEEPKTAPVAEYKVPSGMAFLRAWLTGKKETYLHVDCALSRLFRDGKSPKVTHKKDDILRTIAGVSGGEIDCQVEGFFDIPLSDLPERGAIRSLCQEQSSAGISMQLTGAKVSFTGAPLQLMRWNIRQENDAAIVGVQVRGERVTAVSDKYLLESWDWINEQFLIFVLGRSKDV